MKSIRTSGGVAPDRGVAIHALGGLAVYLDGEDITAQLPKKVAALAVFLACEPAAHSREELRVLLWGGERLVSGSTNVRVALTTLRRIFGARVTISRHTVYLAHDAHSWVDARQLHADITPFLSHATDRSTLDSAAAHYLECALARYQGHFLHGFTLPNAPYFTAWVKYQQAKYQALIHRACAALVNSHRASGAIERSIEVATRWVALDRLEETAQYTLIDLYATLGDRQSALTAYGDYHEELRRLLHISPGTEVQALYRSLCQPAKAESMGGRPD